MNVVFVAVQVLPKEIVIVLETFLMNVAFVVEAELLTVLVIVLETFLMNVAVCGGDNSSCSGCTNPAADNYDSSALVDDGSCIYIRDVLDPAAD